MTAGLTQLLLSVCQNCLLDQQKQGRSHLVRYRAPKDFACALQGTSTGQTDLNAKVGKKRPETLQEATASCSR